MKVPGVFSCELVSKAYRLDIQVKFTNILGSVSVSVSSTIVINLTWHIPLKCAADPTKRFDRLLSIKLVKTRTRSTDSK